MVNVDNLTNNLVIRGSSEWYFEYGFSINDLNIAKEKYILIHQNLKKIQKHLKKLKNFESGILIDIIKHYNDPISIELIEEYNQINYIGWTNSIRKAYLIYYR